MATEIVRELVDGEWVTTVGTGGGGGGLPLTGWTGDEANPQSVNTNGGNIAAGDVTSGDVSDDAVVVGGGRVTVYEDGDVVAVLRENSGGRLELTTPGEGQGYYSAADIGLNGSGGSIGGFDYFSLTTTPEVPATPTAQNIVDVLVTLGLVTQAAP